MDQDVGVQWEWMTDDHKWAPFTYSQNQHVEKAFKDGKIWTFIPDLGEINEYVAVLGVKYHWVDSTWNAEVGPYVSFSLKRGRVRPIRRRRFVIRSSIMDLFGMH